MKPASVECIPVRSGRSLLKVSDPLESLRRRVDEFGDAWLHVSVKTEGPHPGIAEEVRAFLPNALVVVADYERKEVSAEAREGRSLSEQYSDYVQEKRGVEPDPALRAAFDSLADEVGAHL
jgi:hypothetical protein